jgi:hypothetical protein
MPVWDSDIALPIIAVFEKVCKEAERMVESPSLQAAWRQWIPLVARPSDDVIAGLVRYVARAGTTRIGILAVSIHAIAGAVFEYDIDLIECDRNGECTSFDSYFAVRSDLVNEGVAIKEIPVSTRSVCECV